MLIRYALSIALLWLTVACADVPPGLEDPLVVLRTGHLYPGETLKVTVQPLLSPTWLFLAGDSVETMVLDDSTVATLAPARGSYEVLVRQAGRLSTAGVARVYGFRDVTFGPPMTGYPVPVMRGLPLPIILVNGESSLTRVDLRTNAVTAFPAAVHRVNCMRGVGPTHDAAVFLTSDCGLRSGRWRLWRAPTRLDSAIASTDRIAAQLGDSAFLVAAHHWVRVQHSRAAVGPLRTFEEVNGFVFSPRGDRVIQYYGRSLENGVPVWSTATGDTAFTLHDARAATAGGFTPEGDTLYLAVWDSLFRLVRLDATTGERMGEARIPVAAEDVVVDPVAPYVYVFGWTSAREPRIGVYHRDDLSLVAQIQAPPASQNPQPEAALPCYFCDNRMFIDPSLRVLYVVEIQSRDRYLPTPAPPSIVLRFDLKP